MAVSVYKIAEAISNAVDPLGAKVKVDTRTDNIIVTSAEKGFVITRNWISDRLYHVAEDAKAVVELMNDGHDEVMLPNFIMPLKILSAADALASRDLATQFD